MELIAGRGRGLFAIPALGVLHVLSWFYGALISIRNWYYNRWSLPVWLEVPVISVGNITVGGTGKTPMAIWLCKQMLKRKLKPAVLSRGYKATDTTGPDELLLVNRQCPEAVAVAHPNRPDAGRLAVQEYKAEAAILDDGFQHRRLGRDLDIVLIDATRPFGYEHLLPRGLLREPLENLKRAEAIVITRCEQCDVPAIQKIENRIEQICPQVPIVHAVHRPSGFTDLAGKLISAPVGRRAGCFAGIARPEAFVNSLIETSVSIAETRWWPDHHAYTPADAELIIQWIKQAQLDCLITTEKDAVKLASMEVDWPVPVTVLRIELQIISSDRKVMDDLIDTMLRDYKEQVEPKDATD